MSDTDEPRQSPSDALNALRRHRQEIYAFASSYGISNIRVFGPGISEDENSADEYDLHLIVDLVHGRSLFDTIGFALAIEDDLGFHVEVLTVPGLHDEILASAVQL